MRGPSATSRPRRRSARALLPLTTAMLTVTALASPAWAHNTLIDSTPQDQATLDEAPQEVTLTFDAEVQEGGNGIVVTGPEGDTHERGDVSVDGTEATIDLATLDRAGEYAIDYRIISADGHPLEDTLTFALSEAAITTTEPTANPTTAEPHSAPESPAADTTDTALSMNATTLGALVAIGVIGLLAVAVLVLRRYVRGGDGG